MTPADMTCDSDGAGLNFSRKHFSAALPARLHLMRKEPAYKQQPHARTGLTSSSLITRSPGLNYRRLEPMHQVRLSPPSSGSQEACH